MVFLVVLGASILTLELISQSRRRVLAICGTCSGISVGRFGAVWYCGLWRMRESERREGERGWREKKERREGEMGWRENEKWWLAAAKTLKRNKKTLLAIYVI